MTAACQPAINLDHDPAFQQWTQGLRALFFVAEEYELANAIYAFGAAYLDGQTPQEAYDEFDKWTQE